MQKFIVTGDGVLKYGDVNLHRDLLDRDEYCIGGGVYEFDYLHNRMLLSGKSYDFGRVKWSYLDALLVPATLQGMDLYYEDLPITDFVSQIKVLGV